MRKTSMAIMILGMTWLLWSQEGVDNGNREKPLPEGEEPVTSLNQEKREILLYGIDAEVKDLISVIRSEKDTSLNKELLYLIRESENPEILRVVFDFFADMKIDLAKERAMELLQKHLDDHEYSVNLLISGISYLGNIKAREAGDLFYALLRDGNPALAAAALGGIGKIQDDSRADEIQGLLEEYSSDEEYQDFSATAILVLGELGHTASQKYFEDVLQDEDAPASHRQYAAISLGKFGQEDSMNLMMRMYNETADSQLRSYLLKGITHFEDPEVQRVLVSALRDSFWRIRMAAAEGLGDRQARDALGILEYKVQKDPVRQVRYASLKAIANMDTEDSRGFVLSQFEKEKVPFDIRQKALEFILEKKIPGAVKVLEKVLESKWEKDRDNELGPICQILSTSEWARLEPFYQKMLENKDFIIRIYGIRGIKLNKISSMKPLLEKLEAEGQAVNVRREAKAALETF